MTPMRRLASQISTHSFGNIRDPKSGGEHLGELINELMIPDAERRLGAAGGHAVMQHAYFGDGTVNWTKLADNEMRSPLLGVAQAQAELQKQGDEVEQWVRELAHFPFEHEDDSWFGGYK